MILEFFQHVSQDYTLQIVLLGTTIFGFTSGALGVFALLRRQSLLGDAISHASLPGLAGAFLLTHSCNPAVLMVGAILAGCLGVFFVHIISHKTSLKKDAALGIVLSVFFGFGLVLLTHIQKKPVSSQVILNKFLFGDASVILYSDIFTMVFISFIVFVCLLLFWKEFKIIAFDPVFAKAAGLPTHNIDMFMTLLLVLSIVIGLQTVGVVLMSTMLIAPAAAARQWVHNLGYMVILAGIIGACCGIAGALISSRIDQLPTGPTIVVIASFCVFVSLLVAPNRGLLWQLKYKSL